MTDYNNDPALVLSQAELVEAIGALIDATGFVTPSRRVGRLNLLGASNAASTALRNAETLAGKIASEKS